MTAKPITFFLYLTHYNDLWIVMIMSRTSYYISDVLD